MPVKGMHFTSLFFSVSSVSHTAEHLIKPPKWSGCHGWHRCAVRSRIVLKLATCLHPWLSPILECQGKKKMWVPSWPLRMITPPLWAASQPARMCWRLYICPKLCFTLCGLVKDGETGGCRLIDWHIFMCGLTLLTPKEHKPNSFSEEWFPWGYRGKAQFGKWHQMTQLINSSAKLKVFKICCFMIGLLPFLITLILHLEIHPESQLLESAISCMKQHGSTLSSLPRRHADISVSILSVFAVTFQLSEGILDKWFFNGLWLFPSDCSAIIGCADVI